MTGEQWKHGTAIGSLQARLYSSWAMFPLDAWNSGITPRIMNPCSLITLTDVMVPACGATIVCRMPLVTPPLPSRSHSVLDKFSPTTLWELGEPSAVWRDASTKYNQVRQTGVKSTQVTHSCRAKTLYWHRETMWTRPSSCSLRRRANACCCVSWPTKKGRQWVRFASAQLAPTAPASLLSVQCSRMCSLCPLPETPMAGVRGQDRGGCLCGRGSLHQ